MKRILSISIFALLLSLTMQAQVVSLNVIDKPLRDVLPMVEQQCDYHFFYNSNLPGLDSRVTVNRTKTPLEQALRRLCDGTGISYKMAENNVIVLSVEEKKSTSRTVRGVVLDKSNNDPIIGATVVVKGTTQGTITDYVVNFSIDAASGQYL